MLRKLGYANYYFNKLEQKRLMDAFRTKGDFSGLRGDWTMKAVCTLGKKTTSAQITVKAPTKEDKNERVVAEIDLVDFSVDPLSTDTKVEDLVLPPASGGLLVALYQYRQLLAFGDKGFTGDFSHGGVAPFYPPLPGDAKPDYAKQRVMCEVLRTRLAGVPARWYFSKPTAICSASRSPWIPTTIRARSTCRTTISRTADRCRAHGGSLQGKDLCGPEWDQRGRWKRPNNHVGKLLLPSRRRTPMNRFVRIGALLRAGRSTLQRRRAPTIP